MRRVLRNPLVWVLLLSGFAVTALGLPLMPASPVDPQIRPLYEWDGRSPAVDNGGLAESEQFYVRQLYRLYIHDAAARLNVPSLTGMSDNAFATLIAAKIIAEDATIYADDQPAGLAREIATLPPTVVGHPIRDWAEVEFYQGEISWGPANITYPNAKTSLVWWRKKAASLGHKPSDVRTAYYDTGQRGWLTRQLMGWNEETDLLWEMQTGQGTIEILAVAILHSADRARRYYASAGQPVERLSAYTIAMGVEASSEPTARLYALKFWRSRGFYQNWVETMDGTARTLGLKLSVPEDYLPYTRDEQRLLDALPAG